MKAQFLTSILVAVCCTSAWADDEEMKTETKVGAPSALPSQEKPKSPSAKPPSAADLALRTQIRKHAPFWIEDAGHGAAIRLNKDGSFTSEAQGGGSVAGQWKVIGGELNLQWADGEKYGYSVAVIKDGTLVINGKRPQKDRYKF